MSEQANQKHPVAMIITGRLSMGTPVTQGGVEKCSKCQEDCWVSHSSRMDIVAAGATPGDVLCTVCYMKDMQNEDPNAAIEVLMPGENSMREILQQHPWAGLHMLFGAIAAFNEKHQSE